MVRPHHANRHSRRPQNRLLEMIRHQQAQLQAIQSQVNSTPLGSSAAVADTTPPSGRFTAPTNPTLPPNLPTSNPPPSSPFRSSLELSRQSSRRSRTPSRTASPSLRPVSAGIQAQGEDWFSVGRRQSMSDEGAFYQAETQMLTRENQMLRQRIRELGMSFKGIRSRYAWC